MDSFQIKIIGNSTTKNLVEHMLLIHEELIFQLHQAQDHHKEYANEQRKHQLNFKLRDQVWLLLQNIQTTRPSKKLEYHKLGPFQIICQVNPVAFCLALPTSMKIRPVFHVSSLERYYVFIILGRTLPPPPPIEINNELEYEVEEVLNSRFTRKRLE